MYVCTYIPIYTYIYIYLYIHTYICINVCSQNTAKTVHDSTKNFGPPYSPFSCGVQYQVSFKSGNEKNYLKNQFPIQSSTLREYLINANKLSGIIRWSHLFLFFEMIFFHQPLSQREPNGFTGHLVLS